MFNRGRALTVMPVIYETEQREIENSTFKPKLNKKANIRKSEASILVQNYYSTVISARRGQKPSLINKDLLKEELIKQEKEKRDAEKKAKALKKKRAVKTKKRDQSNSDYNDDDTVKAKVENIIGLRPEIADTA